MTTQVDLLVLGDVVVRSGDVSHSPSSTMVRTVLGALGVSGGRLGDAALVAALWPRDRSPSSRSAVSVTVHRARMWLDSVAGQAIRIERTSSGYALRLTGGELDAVRLRRCDAEAATRTGAARRAALAEAAGLWRGPLLADVPADRRPALAVAELDRLGAALRLEFGRVLLTEGDAPRAAALAEAVTHEHPFDEPAHVLLMEALTACGRPAEAARGFAELRRRLHADLGVEPSPVATATFQRITQWAS